MRHTSLLQTHSPINTDCPGILGKSIGDAMGIEYKGRLEKNEWKDGLEFYEDIRA